MHRQTSILIAVLVLLFSISTQAQAQVPEILFIINKSGDSLVTSKIFKNKTNEDQVVFKWEGKRKVLKAKEVKSYYKKGRLVSINISSDNQNKLVKIVVRGTVKLAQTISSKRVEKFYVLINGKWIDLDPHSLNLKDYLSELLPDFGEVIKTKKVHYNLPFLGKVISQYNEYKDPKYKMTGSFKYTERIKVGVFGSIGTSKININEFPADFGKPPISTTFGLAAHAQYSRLFSLRLQLDYAQSDWKNEDWDIKLKTLNFTPLFGTQLYGNSKFFKLSAAIGFNFNLDLGSQITAPGLNTEPIGLAGLGFGYDFQLYSTLGEHFEFFVSYQIITKQKTEIFGILNPNQVIEFSTNQFRFGLFVYL